MEKANSFGSWAEPMLQELAQEGKRAQETKPWQPEWHKESQMRRQHCRSQSGRVSGRGEVGGNNLNAAMKEAL